MKTNHHRTTVFLGRLLLAMLVTEALVMAFFNLAENSDLFLGLAAGREVLAGRLASPDQWSFTAPGLIWVDQSWLSHTVFYVSYELTRDAGPVLLKALLLLGSAAIMFVRCRRLGISLPVTLVCLAFGLLAAAPFVRLRAENFGVFYFLLFVMLLSDFDSKPAWQRYGLPAVMLVWSNSHGSFILGLSVLAIKTLLAIARKFVQSPTAQQGAPGQSRIVQWVVILAASIALVCVGSPFGIRNLTMPFTQVGTEVVTQVSADWLPLTSLIQMRWFLGFGSVYPYLTFLLFILFCLFGLLMFAKRLERRTPSLDQTAAPEDRRHALRKSGWATVQKAISQTGLANSVRGMKFDWLMEAIAVLLTCVLAFKFRRFLLFSAFAFIPVAAIVLQLLVETHARRREGAESGPRAVAWSGRLGMAVLLIITLALGGVVYRVSLVPYAPDNPLRPKTPLMRSLMSYDTLSEPVARFLTENRINGRVLAGWQISSYLLLQAPGTRLFMDTRDQSFYPEQILQDYFEIMGVTDRKNAARLSLLDKYGVSTVVMTTYPYDFDLAADLLRTKKWGCIYKDDYTMVLVRSDSERFSEMLSKADFSRLRYADEETKVRSEAFQSYSQTGTIRPDLLQELRIMVEHRPWPNYYLFICSGMDNMNGCFKAKTRDFLSSEAARLAKIRPVYAHSAEEVLQSRITILELLEQSANRCGDRREAEGFKATRQMANEQYEALARYYLGKVF
ncbi:MAG: hypothetical protein AB1664_16950 [Thermodesulfobacteriota bacterium]